MIALLETASSASIWSRTEVSARTALLIQVVISFYKFRFFVEAQVAAVAGRKLEYNPMLASEREKKYCRKIVQYDQKIQHFSASYF